MIENFTPPGGKPDDVVSALTIPPAASEAAPVRVVSPTIAALLRATCVTPAQQAVILAGNQCQPGDLPAPAQDGDAKVISFPGGLQL